MFIMCTLRVKKVQSIKCALSEYPVGLKIRLDSISEHYIFKNFLGGMPPDPPEGLCFTLCRVCFAYPQCMPPTYGHAILQMANQI